MKIVLPLFAVLCALPASAYTLGSPVARGCHERISAEALRTVRGEFPVAQIDETRDERALIDELPFKTDADMKDLAGASLMIGVRDPDLKGHDTFDLSDIASVHGDPHGQVE